MEKKLSLQELYKTIHKRLKLIFLLTVLVTAIVGAVSFLFLTPVYESSAEILVNNSTTEDGQFTNQNIQTDLQLVNTYSGIIKSPVILDQVIENRNLDMTTEQLIKKITVSNTEQSQIVTISVRDQDPVVAVEVANTTASVFEKDIQQLMNIDNVTILSPAVLKENPIPVAPNPILNMAIGGVIGLMIGVGIAVLLDFLDMTIKDQQDIEDILNLPLLGQISPIVEKAELKSNNNTLSKRKVGYINDKN